MFKTITLALAASNLCSAAIHRHGRGHKHIVTKSTTTPPANPIKVASANFLCDVTSDLPLERDLGFVGKIQDTIIYTYGDSQTLPGYPNWWMTSDSSSIGTGDPCHVLNTQRTSDGQHQTDMIAPNSDWGETNTEYGFGGSNVLATSGNEGMMFYAVNHRPNGQQTILGAGVAKVTLTGKNVTTERLAQYWWNVFQDGQPKYGEAGAYSDGTYLYGLGHGGPSPGYIYLNRVKRAQWQTLSNWEYYDGSTGQWGSKPLSNPSANQALQWNSAEGATWGVAWGSPIWSPYYKKIVWVYTIAFPGAPTQIWARTADNLTGPWSKAAQLYTVTALVQNGVSDFVYCSIANPYYDASGKSIIVTIDNGAATVQATKVVFE